MTRNSIAVLRESLTQCQYLMQVPVVAGIRGSVLVTFPGCGHLALFQEVDKFVGLVNNFTAAAGAFTPQPDSYYTCSSA